MAKWGEGDPRWIVEERPDATNVNNWHWTEKNATQWSKKRFEELFTDFKIDKNDVECAIVNIESCTGEATANNRKGKLIFFYEWQLTLNWNGLLTSGSNSIHKGKIDIPNLSEEHDVDDIEITISIDESNDESEKLKQFMYNIGRDIIRKQLEVYVRGLKEEYSKNLILPKKDECISQSNEIYKRDQGFHCIKNISKEITSNDDTVNTVGCKLDVRTLSMIEEFQCSANDLYLALTRADMITAFTRAPVKAEPIKGGEFQLYGGNVYGKYDELVPGERLVLSWRLKSWPSGHYSSVLIELEEQKNGTKMKLKQTGIPASEYDAMKTNWYRYYWYSIKQTFGFGVPMADVF